MLTRHKVRIVSKVSNANTITHYVDSSLKVLRRVEKDLTERYPSACVTSRAVAMAAAVGRDLGGLAVLSRGLNALADAGLSAIGATQGPRAVDVQFIVERNALSGTIKALHAALVETQRQPLSAVA